ncbi:MAG: hypothetical protein O2923_09535 [Verrucomicrobia bacterium]|nr:hypothetical protein [Verrucomicrobiota bacterium]MDA1086519.1 hypothetical protein [Verrucomicrobiota bacterium]
MSHDTDVLRRLAERVREICELQNPRAREQLWRKHNGLRSERPMVLCFPEGAWEELLPHSALECNDPIHRDWEYKLRSKIYWWEHIRDDNFIEPWFDIAWCTSPGNYGVEIPHIQGDQRGSYVWDHPLKEFHRDFTKLHFRTPSVDRVKTYEQVERADAIFGPTLPPRIRGQAWWTVGLTWTAVLLVGIEPFMLMMCDDPAAVHQLMAWLRDEQSHFIDWHEKQGLLRLMSGSHYVGSGGVGCTDDLPAVDFMPGAPARTRDIWGFAESQETVGISPAMFEEFILPYQLPLLDRFGLNCYGCCEPVHSRIDSILTIPRLRRVSVSPWADEQTMAEKLNGQAIFSRKPHPATVCLGFREEAVRDDIRKTLQTAGGCALELIMKDTHTVENEPWRLTRWVQIAYEEIEDHLEKGSTYATGSPEFSRAMARDPEARRA